MKGVSPWIRGKENGRKLVEGISPEIVPRLDRSSSSQDCPVPGKDLTYGRLIVEGVIGHLPPEAGGGLGGSVQMPPLKDGERGIENVGGGEAVMEVFR
jgi:hypothetical protein